MVFLFKNFTKPSRNILKNKSVPTYMFKEFCGAKKMFSKTDDRNRTARDIILNTFECK